MYNNKALVIGANYYIGLSAIRCLGSQGVPVAAVDYSRERAYAFKSRWCREQLLAPNYRRQPQAFIDFLLDTGKGRAQSRYCFPPPTPMQKSWTKIITPSGNTSCCPTPARASILSSWTRTASIGWESITAWRCPNPCRCGI